MRLMRKINFDRLIFGLEVLNDGLVRAANLNFLKLAFCCFAFVIIVTIEFEKLASHGWQLWRSLVNWSVTESEYSM